MRCPSPCAATRAPSCSTLRGIHHPLTARGGRTFTPYEDVIHLTLSQRALWIGTRNSVTVLPRNVLPAHPTRPKRSRARCSRSWPRGPARARSSRAWPRSRSARARCPPSYATWGLVAPVRRRLRAAARARPRRLRGRPHEPAAGRRRRRLAPGDGQPAPRRPDAAVPPAHRHEPARAAAFGSLVRAAARRGAHARRDGRLGAGRDDGLRLGVASGGRRLGRGLRVSSALSRGSSTSARTTLPAWWRVPRRPALHDARRHLPARRRRALHRGRGARRRLRGGRAGRGAALRSPACSRAPRPRRCARWPRSW